MDGRLAQVPKTRGISVVIPTLGGSVLADTIAKLNAGTVVPDEILVCIPNGNADQTSAPHLGPNVAIIRTPCRGQVGQRAFGFRQAKHGLVLQLDDDIHVRRDALEQMIACVEAYGDAAAGPRLYDIATGAYRSFMMPHPTGPTGFERFLFWIINGTRGYVPGHIGRAGISMGIPENPGTWVDVGWLPGGCVLHRRENLVLDDYYPFKGKAFVEDLYHSVLLRRRNVRLVRCDAACDADFSSGTMRDPLGFIKLYWAYARALTGLVLETGGSLFFLYSYLALYIPALVARKIFAGRDGGAFR